MADHLENSIDLMYEAALNPARWRDALGALAQSLNAVEVTCLHFHASTSPDLVCLNLEQEQTELFRSGYWRASPSIAQAMSQPMWQPVHLGRDIPARQLHDDLAMQQLFDLGLGDPIGVLAPDGNSGRLGLLVCGVKGREPFGEAQIKQISLVSRHLSRVFGVVSNALRRESETVMNTLEAMHLPAATLSRDRRVIMANATFQRDYSYLAQGFAGRLTLPDRQDNDRFRIDVENIAEGRQAAAAILVADRYGERPTLSLRVMGIFRSARDILCDAQVLLTVHDCRKALSPSSDRLVSVLGLTPAEARVAAHLAAGQSPAMIAETLQLSIHTIRTQLRAAMAKTDTKSQVELIRSLSAF